MEFRIDFSHIDFVELRNMNVSLDEISSIFTSPTSYHEPVQDFMYAIGFGSGRKFIQIAYQISKKANFELEILQIDLPYEKDIKQYWCRHS